MESMYSHYKKYAFRRIAEGRVRHLWWLEAELWARRAVWFVMGIASANLVAIVIATIAGVHEGMPVGLMNASVIAIAFVVYLTRTIVGVKRHAIRMGNIDREHSMKMFLAQLKGY